MKTKKMTIGILAALIATSMVFAVNAGNKKGRGQNGDRGMRGFPMLASLELTEAQAQKVDALREKERAEIDKIRAEMDKVHADIRAQWEKETVDKTKLKSLHKKMQSLKAKMGDARLEFRLGVYDILTPEQRKKAAEERKAFHENRQNRRGGNGNPDGYGQGDGPCDGGCGRGRGRGGRGMGRGMGDGPMW
ncbi:MAG: Spy/CpxP family protein refolding chaperone [Deltaproteobacteria bacterium]|nr:Spy/CpxP family protein refolding chaperone [Deltaproteobacteria bacterium]